MFNLKSEFLAEVSHAPLGVFAVLMGWGRWLELRLPEEDRRIPAWVWPVAFTLIGLTLLLYREILGHEIRATPQGFGRSASSSRSERAAPDRNRSHHVAVPPSHRDSTRPAVRVICPG